MDLPLSPEDMKKLNLFIAVCSANPAILNLPQLSFFKEFVERLGGKIPEGTPKMPETCPFGRGDAGQGSTPQEPKPEQMEEDEESEPESDLEPNPFGDVDLNDDVEQPMGDETKVSTEEEIDQANELRGQAAAAFSQGEYQESINLYTKAIELNPGNALYHAKRGQAFLKLNKPIPCIRDCDHALKLNCDSAAAFKFRGRAHQLMGHWEAAAQNLRQACKLDYDDDANEWLREVTPNAIKIEQRRIKKERKLSEKPQKPAETKPEDKANLFNFMKNFGDQEVIEGMKDMFANPSNVHKYKDNPKFEAFVNAAKSFPNAAGFVKPEFMANLASSFTGQSSTGDTPPTSATATPPPKASAPRPDFVDDGLD